MFGLKNDFQDFKLKILPKHILLDPLFPDVVGKTFNDLTHLHHKP